MKTRCHNPNSSSYKNYGAIGISVCKRWRRSFAAFIADMGACPEDAYTIERNDSTVGYRPSNCRWALRSEQARNRRATIKLTLNGVTLPMSEWAEQLHVPYDLLSQRWRRGWSDTEILNTPYKEQRSKMRVSVIEGRRKHGG
jgi:hypothetical protein